MVYDIETGGGADAVPRRGLHTGAGLGLASDAGSQGQAAVPRRPAGPSRPSRHSYRSPRNAVAPSSAHSDPARAPGVGDLRMQDMQSVLDLRVSKLPRSEPRPGTSHPGGDDNATQHALAPASARPAAPGAAAGVVSRRNAASSSGADGGPATSRQSMEEHLSSLVPGSSFLTEGAVAESLQQSVGFEVVSAAVAESETRRTAVRNGAPLLGTLEALDPMASATRGYQLVARVAAKSGAPSNRLDVNRCLDFDAVRDGSFSSAVDDGAQQEESTLDRIQRVFAREPLPQRLGRRLADARFDSDIGILSRAGSMGGSDMGGARPAQGRPAAAGMEGSTSPRSVPPLALANSSIADAEASSRTQSRRPRPPGRTRSNAVKQTKFGPVLARSLRSRRQTRRIPRPAILGGGAARPYSGDAMREMARQGPATHKREPLTERRGRRSGHDADDEGGAAEDGDGSGPDEADVPTRRRSAADSGGGGSLANPRVAAAGTVLSLSTLAGTGTSRGMNGEAQEPAEASPVRNTRGRTAHDESVSAVQGLFATASAFRSAQVQGVNQLNNTLDAVAYARADKSRRKHIVRAREIAAVSRACPHTRCPLVALRRAGPGQDVRPGAHVSGAGGPALGAHAQRRRRAGQRAARHQPQARHMDECHSQGGAGRRQARWGGGAPPDGRAEAGGGRRVELGLVALLQHCAPVREREGL